MKEWYLISNKTRPNMIGGYENESFLDYKNDAFNEALETDIATTVILCNSDLSIQKKIRCIIEGNVADTQLQSLQRKGLFLPGTVSDGMYILFNGGYWLITGLPGTNGIYEKATMSFCQLNLRWQNIDGKIIERWACVEDFTKYSNGLTGNNTLILGDNQYGLILPIDEYTKKLKRDMRFPIDFDDSIEPDIYRLTNKKVKLNDNTYSDHGGTMTIVLSFDSFNKSTDKKVVMDDGNDVWICDYIDTSTLPYYQVPNETSDLSVTISGSRSLKPGFSRTYTAKFSNSNNCNIRWKEIDFKWNVLSDCNIVKTIHENKIDLCVDKNTNIGSKIVLQIIINDLIISSIEITVIPIV